jgi:glycosyltransferase involved in cell wall biosynthesis
MPNELSVLIPVFNVDVRPLVYLLHQQCRQLGLTFEIRCYDDGSEPGIQALNAALGDLAHTHYVVLSRHLGRVDIRNLLAREACYPYLLFLDNDSQVLRPDFIRDYVQAAGGAPVLVGGTCYQPQPPATPYRLHWLYGRTREERPASIRNQHPYQAFYLNNIFLARDLWLRYPLQPLVRDYGHEDSRFGRQLQQAGIPVRHLDNPVLHAGLEPAAVFLRKSRQAIENLYWLYRQEGLGAETKLVRLYRFLKRWRLAQPFQIGYRLMEPYVRKNLLGPVPWLWLFDLYKLYYFSREERAQKSPADVSEAFGK